MNCEKVSLELKANFISISQETPQYIDLFHYNIVMQIHLTIYHPKHAGILSAAVELKTDELLLLHRKDDDFSGLKSALQSRGIKCHSEQITFDTQAVRDQVTRIIAKYHQHQLILNASNSYSKLTLIAFEQFTLNNLPVFLVDKFTDQLNWLKTVDSNQSTDQDIHLNHHLGLNEYLKSFNTQVLNQGQSTPEPNASRQLTEWIISQLGSADQAIGSLNYMAMSADSNHHYEMNQHDLKNHQLQHLLEQFETADMLRLKGRNITFKNQAARFYSNGGWLENHVFSLLYGMRKNRPALKDINKGMTIVRNQGTVRNELDVVAMCHNRLHIIECKTRRFKNSKDGNTAANSAIYRLDTIKAISGGHSGKAMLVSYQPLNKYILSRAKDLGIFCCSHIQLKQLKRHLYQFIDQQSII